MELDELFTNLSYGVLSNLGIGDNGSGTIPVQHRPKLVTYVNKALHAIYTRFNLLEKELIIRLITGKDNYTFEKIYADQDATVGLKYIEDDENAAFDEDVLKILQVYDQDMLELKMNDPGDPASLFTPDHKSILVPLALTGNYLHILYQAKHPKLVVAPPVGVTQIILAPEVLHGAIEHHIAYQVYSPMSSQEAKANANEQFSLYNAACIEVEARDHATTSLIQTHTKLEDRGWV